MAVIWNHHPCSTIQFIHRVCFSLPPLTDIQARWLSPDADTQSRKQKPSQIPRIHQHKHIKAAFPECWCDACFDVTHPLVDVLAVCSLASEVCLMTRHRHMWCLFDFHPMEQKCARLSLAFRSTYPGQLGDPLPGKPQGFGCNMSLVFKWEFKDL